MAAAFDAAAPAFDDGHGRNPVVLLFRHLFQSRLLRLFGRGSRVLDLGCGTGDDALLLASRGVCVHALDVSGAMLSNAMAKASARGLTGSRLRFEQRPAEELGELGAGTYDGAYSNFGALNCAHLPSVGSGLASVLRPGAPVLLSLAGPWPLPALLERGLTGRGEARRRAAPRISGVAVPASFPSPREVRHSLGAAFRWGGDRALGLLLPGPSHAEWASRNPQAFGLLASVEAVARTWPLLRGMGDHVVLEGVRVPETSPA